LPGNVLAFAEDVERGFHHRDSSGADYAGVKYRITSFSPLSGTGDLYTQAFAKNQYILKTQGHNTTRVRLPSIPHVLRIKNPA
jgi:hypothetical protein